MVKFSHVRVTVTFSPVQSDLYHSQDWCRRVWIVDWQGKNPVPLRVRQSQTAYGMCRVYNESTCGGNSAHGTDTAMLNKREEELLDLAYIEEYCSEFIFHESSEQS